MGWLASPAVERPRHPRPRREALGFDPWGLGRLHVGLGNGLVYDQGIDSDIHIDFVLPTPTVTIDGQAIIVGGRATDPSLTMEAAALA